MCWSESPALLQSEICESFSALRNKPVPFRQIRNGEDQAPVVWNKNSPKGLMFLSQPSFQDCVIKVQHSSVPLREIALLSPQILPHFGNRVSGTGTVKLNLHVVHAAV
jgi:hypothetical protein